MNSAIQPLRRSPLHERSAAQGARFVPFAGYEMPVQYAGVTKEHLCVRTAVGIFDVSHMGELELWGAGAAAALDRIVTSEVLKLSEGHALYTVACNDSGTILDDLIVYRLGAERFLVVCNASNRDKMRAHFARETEGRCCFADRSDEYGLLALQGPLAMRLLARVGTDPRVLGLPRMGVTETKFAGCDVIVARTGYTGEDGVELFTRTADARTVWDALIASGEPLGISPIGLGARDTLRLEARLSLYGNEIDETTNPLEAGIGWTVKLDKGPFIGREALQRVKALGLWRKLVGIEMVGRGIARHGYPVLDAAGKAVGHVTSGSPSLSLHKNIGLCYVPVALSKIGSKLAVEIRGIAVEATVVQTPFYKRSE